MTDTFDLKNVSWIFTQNDLDHFLERFNEFGEVTLDLETNGLDEWNDGSNEKWPIRARVVLGQFTFPDLTTYLLPLAHPDSPWVGRWREVFIQTVETMRDLKTGIIGHNVKFDLRWIYASTGISVSHLLKWDTMISSHLLDENNSTKLKRVVPKMFGVEPWDDIDFSKIINGKAPAENADLFQLGEYGAQDTYWTMVLAKKHRYILATDYEPTTPDEVEDSRLGDLAKWCSMPTMATLTAIEQRGIQTDPAWIQSRLEEEMKTRDEHYDWLVNLYPREDDDNPSFAPTSNWFKRWAEVAVSEGDLIVAALTPTGKPQWSKDVLRRQSRNDNKVAGSLLEYRTSLKLIEYLTSWQKLMSPDGTIHAQYNAGSVVTGRLSSSSPNMQQITKQLRPAFVPRKGYYIADLDYSQIEMRIAAYIARCIPMIEAYQQGADLHSMLAAQIAGVSIEDVTKDQRQGGKAGNFGFLFGMGPGGFQMYADAAYGVEFTYEQSEDVYDKFFETWDGMHQWHIRQVARAQQTGQVVSPIGRVRRLPDIHSGNAKIASGAERQSINSPVQGFASDMMQIAAASIEGNIPGVEPVEEAFIVGTVHDSLVLEVPISNWQEVVAECISRMVNVGDILEKMGCTLDLPILAEASVGTRWGLSDISG